jgi:hypothetical protein
MWSSSNVRIVNLLEFKGMNFPNVLQRDVLHIRWLITNTWDASGCITVDFTSQTPPSHKEAHRQYQSPCLCPTSAESCGCPPPHLHAPSSPCWLRQPVRGLMILQDCNRWHTDQEWQLHHPCALRNKKKLATCLSHQTILDLAIPIISIEYKLWRFCDNWDYKDRYLPRCDFM